MHGAYATIRTVQGNQPPSLPYTLGLTYPSAVNSGQHIYIPSSCNIIIPRSFSGACSVAVQQLGNSAGKALLWMPSLPFVLEYTSCQPPSHLHPLPEMTAHVSRPGSTHHMLCCRRNIQMQIFFTRCVFIFSNAAFLRHGRCVSFICEAPPRQPAFTSWWLFIIKCASH